MTVTFLDNLRALMVVLVLVFHAGASYSSAVDFWPFHHPNPNELIDIFMFLGDVFMMSVLFFIAGYFALPSISKRGCRRFLATKFKALGIPWLVVTVGILPVLDYIHFTAHNPTAMNFGKYWLLSMQKILEFHFGWLDMTSYRPMTEHFYQRYAWFLSLLLLFFIIFAVLYAVRKKTDLPPHNNIAAAQSNWAPLMLGGLLTMLPFAVVKLFFYQDILDSGWFSLWNVVQFQLGKVFIYAIYFVLGAHAYAKKWFAGNIGIGRWWGWGALCLLLFGLNMLVFKNLSETREQLLVYKVFHVILYPLWILSFVGMFLAFAVKHWNKSTPFNSAVAANSYNMYLTHYIFPLTLPLMLSRWAKAPAKS